MPLNLDFEFSYVGEPSLAVRIGSPQTGRNVLVRALIDTGAQATLLDEAIARRLQIDLSSVEPVRLTGVGGSSEARFAEVEVQLLDEPDLSSRLTVGFAPGIGTGLGNLIGLDVLGAFDFGLSHAWRLGYLGKAAT
jgi:hypothetical protein